MKKIFFNEKGSISLFVLITMLFFCLYSFIIYNSISETQISQVKTGQRIKEIYEKDLDNIDQIYLELKNS